MMMIVFSNIRLYTVRIMHQTKLSLLQITRGHDTRKKSHGYNLRIRFCHVIAHTRRTVVQPDDEGQC